MRVGIVAQPGNEQAVSLARHLHRALHDRVDFAVSDTVATETGTAATSVGAMRDLPLVVSIGGDGTFLYVARQVGSTPILGVNLGEVGFLVAVSPDDVVAAVREELDHIEETGTPRCRTLPRLRPHGDGIALPPALNEILVHGPRRGRGGGIDLGITIDGSRYAGSHADGVIVATGTGSTAYSLSEAGPIVHPAVDGIVVTAMAPADPVPPIVVSRDASIEVTVRGADRALVASDGSERTWIDPPATVGVDEADRPARIAGVRPDFYRSLRKLDGASHLGPRADDAPPSGSDRER